MVVSRAVVWLIGIVAAIAAHRRASERTVQALILAYFLSLGASETIEAYATPALSIANLPILAVMILVFYVFNPLYLSTSLVAGLAASIAYVIVLVVRNPGPVFRLVEIATVLLLMNGLGAFFQFEALQRRRNEFVVLEQEKSLNKQLTQEIDRRRALEEQLRTMAETDPLTGIFNRRYFTGTAEREVKRALRYGQKLSLMILDLDHFKQVNDRFGHARGDEVLQSVVAIIQDGLREVDVLARLGGEEFGVLLPNTELEAAETAAERIRHAVESYEQRLAGSLPTVTVSIGVAELRHEDGGLDTLYKRTDDALYAAKERGRNQTAVAS
jgi:diguanylate cyclase (GGDEF)-like protein